MQPEAPLGDSLMPSNLRVTSEEINILIYLYLLESNLKHTAFTLLSESSLPATPLFQKLNPSYPSSSSTSRGPHGRHLASARQSVDAFGTPSSTIPRGELVRKLWKALRWEEIERHMLQVHLDNACSSPFHLLLPHIRSQDASTESMSSPPTKRPEPFPLKSHEHLATSDIASQNDDPAFTPTGQVKGKRKSASEGHGSTPRQTRSDDLSGDFRAQSRSPMSVDTRQMAPPVSPPLGRITPVKRPRNSPSEGKSKAHPRGAETKHKGARAFHGAGTSWVEHRDAVTCLAWNPKDKEVLVTGSSDGTAKLWHFEEAGPDLDSSLQVSKKPMSISHKSIDSGKKAVTALVWHPDGTVFATASDGVGRLFTPSGQLQGILTYGRGAINALKFNPSGTSLLAAKDDFTVCLFALDLDLKSPKQLSFEAHTKEVNDVDWLDDDIFASGGNDHAIFIFRANDKRPRFTLKGHTDDVTRVRWSPPREDKERLLASVGDDGNIMIWRLPRYPADRGSTSRSLSPSKQPRDRDGAPDDLFQVVSPGSEYCVNKLQVVGDGTENKRMNTLEWSPLSCGGQDSTVKLFDAISGDCLHVLQGLESGTGSIAFSTLTGALQRHMGILAGGGWNGRLYLWDVETGQTLREHEVDEEPDKQSARDRPMMLTMAWRHDSKQLAVGLQNKSLITIQTGALL